MLISLNDHLPCFHKGVFVQLKKVVGIDRKTTGPQNNSIRIVILLEGGHKIESFDYGNNGEGEKAMLTAIETLRRLMVDNFSI